MISSVCRSCQKENFAIHVQYNQNPTRFFGVDVAVLDRYRSHDRKVSKAAAKTAEDSVLCPGI